MENYQWVVHSQILPAGVGAKGMMKFLRLNEMASSHWELNLGYIYGLCSQCSATEQPDNHLPLQSSVCAASLFTSISPHNI